MQWHTIKPPLEAAKERKNMAEHIMHKKDAKKPAKKNLKEKREEKKAKKKSKES